MLNGPELFNNRFENDKLSEEEELLLSHHDRRWPLDIRPNKSAIRFEGINSETADRLLGDMNAIEGKIFYLPAETEEDAPAFRVVEIIRSEGNIFWEILYDGSGFSIRVDKSELRKLLINSTYAVYE